jgi:hypothetical protein
MQVGSDGRRHVDDSFDQLGLLDVRTSAVAAVELGAAEAVTGFQDGQRGRRHRHGRLPTRSYTLQGFQAPAEPAQERTALKVIVRLTAIPA